MRFEARPRFARLRVMPRAGVPDRGGALYHVAESIKRGELTPKAIA